MRLAHRLARQRGYASAQQLLSEVTWPELLELQAFEELEPSGERRADLRSGIIASTFANAHRSKGQRPFRPEDFMPTFPGESDARTPPEHLTDAAAWERFMGSLKTRAEAGYGRSDGGQAGSGRTADPGTAHG